MSEAYISQIEIFGFDYAPRNWANCAGQLLSVNQNQALFSLLGTTYGGDGLTTFAHPDLRGRVPVGFGQGPGLPNYDLGQRSGEENHALSTTEMPVHNHFINADATTTSGLVNTPSSSVTLGKGTGTAPSGAFAVNLYNSAAPGTTLNPATIGLAGGGQPHANQMPTLTLNFCMCRSGIFPSRN
jgi:microcystin-dependent protein